MSSSGGTKRCLYEVLNLPIESTADQIRSAYRRAALIRHPDKLMQSSLSQAEATASFQELVNAYVVLSDPKERAWYDSHRSQILFSDPRATAGGENAAVPDLFSFFSNTVFSGYLDTRKGFYNVYSDVFDRVYANELNYAKKLGLGLVDSVREAPLMGNLDSPYNQVTAFYSYWLGFGTVMDFCWVDQYDAMEGQNRKSRRVMEEENKKVRKKARREYNETVHGLAEFVKKRDKRVIDMQVKKGLELEKKREIEKEKKREMEKARLERAMAYEEPEWAKADEEMEGFEDDELDESEKRNELYCVVCGKKFKSEKQWKNHEQSKKHKEKVAELGGTLEDELEDEVDENDVDDDLGVTKDDSNVDEYKDEVRNDKDDEILMGEVDEDDIEDYIFVTKEVIVLDELDEQFKDSCDIGKGDVEAESNSIDDEVNEDFGRNFIDKTKGTEPLGLDDEKIDLESMLSGRRNKKKAAAMNAISEKVEFMEYDNRKNTRRSKTNKKSKGMKVEAESMKTEENKGDESSELGESSFHDNDANGKRDQHSENGHKITDETDYRKAKIKKEELNPKSKHLAKGKKSKASKKNDEHLCDTCGEDFESRNKLHKHLGETGHASLKYR